jgi:hypothetical protein
LAAAALAGPGWAQTEPAPAAPPPAKPAAAKPPAKPAAKQAAKPAPAAVEPAPPLTPEEASRQAYKAKLAEDLARIQASLRKQQADLASEQGKLKEFYSQMMEAVSKSESDPAAASPPGATPGAGGPNAKKELSPAVKASVNYEAQTYRVQVARQAVLSSEKEALRLQGFLARMSQ